MTPRCLCSLVAAVLAGAASIPLSLWLARVFASGIDFLDTTAYLGAPTVGLVCGLLVYRGLASFSG